MSPLQVLCVIACCVAVFVGVLTFLTSQGVPLPLALLGLYLSAIGCMLGMQRRARESCEGLERGRRHSLDSAAFDGDAERGTTGEERAFGYSASGPRGPLRTGTYRA